MSQKYKVIYTSLFLNDLDNIIDYIIYKLNNPISANNLLDEIEKEIFSRANNPDSYEKYKSAKKRKNIYYRIYVKNYTIFYVVKNNTMEIRRILYSKRNFERLI